MNDYYKNEEVIHNIIQKLQTTDILTPYEFQCVNTALRKTMNVKQVPYYEVVYHDEYDKTEHRIMEPESIKFENEGNLKIRTDHFSLYFKRLI